jgi:hypothetical protein
LKEGDSKYSKVVLYFVEGVKLLENSYSLCVAVAVVSVFVVFVFVLAEVEVVVAVAVVVVMLLEMRTMLKVKTLKEEVVVAMMMIGWAAVVVDV